MTTALLLPCWAVTAPGLEPLAVAELSVLGIAPGAVEPGGVAFSVQPAALAMVLMQVRTVSRVTVRLAEFHARTFPELEKHAATVAWANVIPPGAAVHFRVTSKKSRLYHQDAIAERLERAAIASVANLTAVRAPSEAEEIEDDLQCIPAVQRIVVRVFRDSVTLSADASGALLHRRGWRQAVARAPMRETLAAALLYASGWATPEGVQAAPLLDPFCGSGTIAIEAALMARRMAPGRLRRFAAEGWPMMAKGNFDQARTVASDAELPAAGVKISAFDRDHGAITAAQSNAERAGVAGDITFSRATISEMEPDGRGGCIVTNPPYGARIGDRTALRDLYATIGRVFQERRPAWQLTMLTADRMLEGQLRLPLREVLRTTNGGIPVHVVTAEPPGR
ncbi:MAG: class I SAM-dependent RNA methyltransferase [Gemmatimonadales bacterium]